MFTTLKNAWAIPELRKKLLYTLVMFLIFRLGANVPVPGIDAVRLAEIFKSQEDGIFGFFNLMSGGGFRQFSVFALGVSPYITSSIILNLLQMAFPALDNLAKQGEEGRKKISQYTRYGAVVIALIQSFGFSVGLFRGVFIDFNPMSVSLAILTLTAGTTFLMYLGERITENGVGNGISLFIFAGIIASLPGAVTSTIAGLMSGEKNIISVSIFVVVALAVIAAVIMVQEGNRKIPVQYAKRVIGRKMYGGQSTHIPLKVNQSGVIPVIFAISILAIPQTISSFMDQTSGFAQFVNRYLTSQSFIWMILEFILIIFFSYFYTSVTFNPIEIADNMKKNGGTIPGIKPGKPTSMYLQKIVNRLTLSGAIFLGLIALLPNLILRFTDMHISFGGTSLLIVVGVALETTKQIEAQMVVRHHRGFLK